MDVSKKLVTAAVASSALSPPTETLPIVTPSAMTGSAVVPVVVVTAPHETPAAAPRPSTNKRARPARLTAKRLARDDSGVVGGDTVDAPVLQGADLLLPDGRPRA